MTIDDKTLVIGATTLICLVAIFKLPDATSVITAVLSGLFGIAVGKALD